MIFELPPADGLQSQFSNKTPLTRSRKWTVQCGICKIPVQRSPSQLLASKSTYCSYACLWESRRRQVKCECAVCSEIYFVKASEAKKKATCSVICHAEHLRRLYEARVNSIGKFRGDGFGKLSFDDIKEIAKSDLKNAELAAIYNVHRNTISKVRNDARKAAA